MEPRSRDHYSDNQGLGPLEPAYGAGPSESTGSSSVFLYGQMMPNGMKAPKSSADKWWGRSTIWGKDKEHGTPMMTRYWIGRLRLHVFYRGDQDPDAHDHPWDFWTFPLTSYVEEVVLPNRWKDEPDFERHRQVVRAWRLTFRPATHTHRVLGRWNGCWRGIHETSISVRARHNFGKGHVGLRPEIDSGRIVTIVWRSTNKRAWGFLKNRDGKWCWTPWREYVFGNGKSAPCE